MKTYLNEITRDKAEETWFEYYDHKPINELKDMCNNILPFHRLIDCETPTDIYNTLTFYHKLETFICSNF